LNGMIRSFRRHWINDELPCDELQACQASG
jgi:hypothetical protein